jgi:hypothetical protein
MFETYRLLGREREAELVRIAERSQRAARTQRGSDAKAPAILAVLVRSLGPRLRVRRPRQEPEST